jgi:hypothetical protein
MSALPATADPASRQSKRSTRSGRAQQKLAPCCCQRWSSPHTGQTAAPSPALPPHTPACCCRSPLLAARGDVSHWSTSKVWKPMRWRMLRRPAFISAKDVHRSICAGRQGAGEGG